MSKCLLSVYACVCADGLVLLSDLAREVFFFYSGQQSMQASHPVKALRENRRWVLVTNCGIYTDPCRAWKPLWKRGKKNEEARWRRGAQCNGVFWKWHGRYTHGLTAAVVTCTCIARDQQFNLSRGRVHETPPLAEDILVLNVCWKRGSCGYRSCEVAHDPINVPTPTCIWAAWTRLNEIFKENKTIGGRCVGKSSGGE